MKNQADQPKKILLPGKDFGRRAMAIFQRIQPELLPEHAKDMVAINVDTGEYELGHTPMEAQIAFQKRWPGKLYFMIRGDGGPVNKFHGM
jgi:hypothetical protein